MFIKAAHNVNRGIRVTDRNRISHEYKSATSASIDDDNDGNLSVLDGNGVIALFARGHWVQVEHMS